MYGQWTRCLPASTTMGMIKLFNELYKNAEENKISRMLLIDFAKAFDRIDHTILIKKLINLNTPLWLCRWVCAFITDRKSRVKYNGEYSNWSSIFAGVPQGTLFGCLGFLILINDLPVSLKYVDDSTIVESFFNPKDSKMNDICNDLLTWCTANNMTLNVSKTIEMRISFKKCCTGWDPIVINNEKIIPSTCTKLLGFKINNKLDWTDHVNMIVEKALTRVHFIRCMLKCEFSSSDILKFYQSFVRPVLEYGNQLWHFGLTAIQSDRIESIQKRVLKLIDKIPYYDHDYSYDLLLSKYNLVSLVERRKTSCHKLFTNIKNKQDHPLHELLPVKAPTSRTLRSASNVPIMYTRTKRYQTSFIPSSILVSSTK